jgi:hypothetical protein
VDTQTHRINNDDPKWVFMGTVKAFDNGKKVKAEDDNGWETEGFSWNRWSASWK